MEFLQQSFKVHFEYKVFFTFRLFQKDNVLLRSFLKSGEKPGVIQKMLFVADEGMLSCYPSLVSEIKEYLKEIPFVKVIGDMLVLPGGEASKNDERFFYQIIEAINKHGIDRHSYLVGIGGGSVLDVAGYAAAVSHRGIRHIRIPTTVLAQNDSGVGVKNGINFFNKKNFLGTFAPPVAVFNDSHFLTTLTDADWRAGMSEAIKVALIKDRNFFRWLEENSSRLVSREMEPMQYLVKRCAELHLQHIAGNDPFETGSSRPLDFGHWSAHKLEQLSGFSVRHGEAVAIGIALDSTYSYFSGRLQEGELKRILNLIKALGLQIMHPMLRIVDERSPLLEGLNEFREHLGGRLTIMLLKGIGTGEEVNEMHVELVKKASEWLTRYHSS